MSDPSDGPLADDDTRTALAAALAAEHAAIWAYGLASAYLAPADEAAATTAATAHRTRRDAVEAFSEGAGVAPAPAAAAYGTPAPVTDARSAAALLAVVEGDTATGWRALLERTDDPMLRRTGIDAVVGASTTGVTWRGRAGTTPLVDPFPGATST